MNEMAPLTPEAPELFSRSPPRLPKQMSRFRALLDTKGFAVIRGPSPVLRWPMLPATDEAASFREELGRLSSAALAWLERATVAGRSAPPEANPDAAGSGRFRHYHWGTYAWRCAPGERFQPARPYADPVSGVRYTTYFQPAGLNPESEIERRFAPFPDDLLADPGLQDLADILFRIIPGRFFPNEGRDPLKMGIHLIKLQSIQGRPGVSSPNTIHVDGERITFVILLERRGIVGGGNLIVERSFAKPAYHPNDVPESARIAELMLVDPLDTLAFDDARWAHYVFPVQARENGDGGRLVLLVDFTPIRPVLSDEML